MVESEPVSLLPAIAEPFLKAGKSIAVQSAGSLLRNDHLIELARETGSQIAVPTGALIRPLRPLQSWQRMSPVVGEERWLFRSRSS